MWNDHSSVIARDRRRIPFPTSDLLFYGASPPPLPHAAIETILFDLDSVLYDNSAWRRWLLQLLAHMGVHTHYTLFYRLWECEFESDVAWGRVEYWQAVRTFLRSTGLTHAQIDEVIAAAAGRWRAFQGQIRPYPHVLAAVTQLALRGVQLVIASSTPWPAEELHGRLAQLRLAKWFPVVFSPRDFRHAATHREWFREVLADRHSSPSRAAYVGRHAGYLSSAARAGLLTVAYNQETDAVADIYLEQFDHLPRLLECQSAPTRAAG